MPSPFTFCPFPGHRGRSRRAAQEAAGFRPTGSSWPTAPLRHGAVGFAGVMLRCTGDQLVLHSREAGDKTILLRPDTRYIENGGAAESSQLLPNMRVFVRAGTTLSNEMEAYQVIWGGILQPR